MSLYDRFIKIEGLSNLPASQREALRVELDRLDRTVARVSAQDNGGGSRSAALDSLFVGKDLYVPAGVILVGPVASGKGNVLIRDGGVQLRTNTTVKIDLQTDGDIFIGENTAAAATTNIAIFTTAQTYNSESMGQGDTLFGDNSSGKANMLWDKSAGELLFRSGAASKVRLTTTGTITFSNAANALLFEDSGGSAVTGGGIDYTSSNNLEITNGKTGKAISLFLKTTANTLVTSVYREDPGQAERTQFFVGPGTQGAKFGVGDGSSLDDVVIQTAGSGGGSAFATFPGALNVGDAFTGTTSGAITYSGNLLSRKGGTNYTGYIFVPLTTPLTSTAWDGDSYSDVGTSTEITRSVFGWPTNVKAVLMQIVTQDSAAWGTDALYFACGPSATFWYALASRPKGGDVDDEAQGIVPCDANASIWYRINASGASTLDVTIWIWGYWI